MPDPTTPPPYRDDEETLDEVIDAETAPKPKSHHSPPPRVGKQKESFIDRAWDTQHNLERKWDSLGSGRFARVLRMARKPEPEEFRQSSMIVLVGIGVIGGIGFAVFLLMAWLMKLLGAN